MTVRVTSGCREGEDELFLSSGSPASLQAQWMGDASGGQTACTLTVTPIGVAQGGRNVSGPIIAEWVVAMRAVGFRSVRSTTGDAVDVTIEFNLTDAASIGDTATNGGRISTVSMSSSVVLNVVPQPVIAAPVPPLPDVTDGMEECPGDTPSDSDGLSSITKTQTVIRIQLQTDIDTVCDTAEKLADTALGVAFGAPENVPPVVVVLVSQTRGRSRSMRVTSAVDTHRSLQGDDEDAPAQLQPAGLSNGTTGTMTIVVPVDDDALAMAALERLAAASLDGSLEDAIGATPGIAFLVGKGVGVRMVVESSAVGAASAVLGLPDAEDNDGGTTTTLVIGIVAGVIAVGVAVAAAYYMLGRSSCDSKEPEDATVTHLGGSSEKTGKRKRKSGESSALSRVKNTE